MPIQAVLLAVGQKKNVNRSLGRLIDNATGFVRVTKERCGSAGSFGMEE